MNNPLRMQIRLQHSPATVFAAFETDALQQWFAEAAAVDLAGGTFNFWGRFTPGNPDQAAGTHPILHADAPHRLKFEWDTNTVTLRFLPHGHGTMLVLDHDSVRPTDYPIEKANFEDFWFLSLENLRRYLDGKPCNLRIDFALAVSGTISHTVEIAAAPETVFPILIEPDKLNRWIASAAHVQRHPGGTIDLGWGEVPSEHVKITELKAPQRLAYGWSMPSSATTVTWVLEGSNGQTRLTFTHSGFEDDTLIYGLYAGWANFIGWVRSIAEYGDDWQPPFVPLDDKQRQFYAASIWDQQVDIEGERA